MLKICIHTIIITYKTLMCSSDENLSAAEGLYLYFFSMHYSYNIHLIFGCLTSASRILLPTSCGMAGTSNMAYSSESSMYSNTWLRLYFLASLYAISLSGYMTSSAPFFNRSFACISLLATLITCLAPSSFTRLVVSILF